MLFFFKSDDICSCKPAVVDVGQHCKPIWGASLPALLIQSGWKGLKPQIHVEACTAASNSKQIEQWILVRMAVKVKQLNYSAMNYLSFSKDVTERWRELTEAHKKWASIICYSQHVLSLYVKTKPPLFHVYNIDSMCGCMSQCHSLSVAYHFKPGMYGMKRGELQAMNSNCFWEVDCSYNSDQFAFMCLCIHKQQLVLFAQYLRLMCYK